MGSTRIFGRHTCVGLFTLNSKSPDLSCESNSRMIAFLTFQDTRHRLLFPNRCSILEACVKTRRQYRFAEMAPPLQSFDGQRPCDTFSLTSSPLPLAFFGQHCVMFRPIKNK